MVAISDAGMVLWCADGLAKASEGVCVRSHPSTAGRWQPPQLAHSPTASPGQRAWSGKSIWTLVGKARAANFTYCASSRGDGLSLS